MFRFQFSRPLLSCVALLISASGVTAQTKVEFPQPSPKASLKQRVGITDIEIEYSRPARNGRDVFGSLVPFGTVWRTGANASTKINFSTAVKIGGKEVPAGKYALYTIPSATDWTFIIYKDPSLSGAAGYKESDDLVRATAKPVTLSAPVESLTLGVSDIKDDAAAITLEWDRTRVSLPFTTDAIADVKKGIEAAVVAGGAAVEGGFYFQAASFYYVHGGDLKKALEWIEIAAGKNPKAYWVQNRKAQILAKTGDKKGAVAAAESAIKINEAQAEVDPAQLADSKKIIESNR